MANGRKSFEKFRWLLLILSHIFGVLPTIVSKFCWAMVDNFEGPISLGIRFCIIHAKAASCGSNVYIGKRVTIKHIENISFGTNISIHSECYLDGFGRIEIFDNVSIAHQSSIVSFEHTWNDSSTPIKYNPTRSDKISIGPDAWIGCGVRILSGSQIGERVVVAAGSVTKGVLNHRSIYAGLPAKKIRSI